MKSVKELPKTTFSGRRFTRRQLTQVQDLVRTFKNLSRQEIAYTVCEHLNWKSPNGKNKIQSSLTLLEELEKHGLISLPAKREQRKRQSRKPAFKETPDTSPVEGKLGSIGPIRLERVISVEDRENWKAYIEEYHYLGYKQPVGAQIGYLVVSEETGRRLGCLLFTGSASWALAPRDNWIGWEDKQRKRHLQLILSNDRFLIFPWVKVKNLASHVLSLATKRIGDDWLEVYGYRPVLIETFVDKSRYSGSCYRAANWENIGETQGRGRLARKKPQKSIKDIYVFPLSPDWRQRLLEEYRIADQKKRDRRDQRSMQTHYLGDGFIALWQKVVHIIHDVSSEYDKEWQIRHRVINSMLLVMLIFRLVTSKNSQGYGTTIDELWENCAKMNLPLPQEKSISESSFCVARKKLDEGIFKDINRRILDAYADETSSCRWRGHRLFAVDGSKLNLPRSLLTKGYNAPSPNAHYPMGLVSCLYEVLTQTPFDFELTSHGNERICAENHLQTLKKNDVVVYDRGYFSYLMLRLHVYKGIHPIFRLQKNSGAKIKNFFTADGYDRIITIKPSEKAQKEIKRNYPYLDLRPLKMRVVKYVIGGYVYCLGTTLFEEEDQPYPIDDLKEVYHARWGVEELYKISKRVFIIENFHAKTVRGVKQEIYAHFTLVTMNRFFSNEAESQINQDNQSAIDSGDMKSPKHGSLVDQLKKIKINFKNCVHVFTRGLEELVLLHDQMASAIKRTFESVIGKRYKVRPNRAFPRISLRPSRKWSPSKEAKTQKKLTSAVTSS